MASQEAIDVVAVVTPKKDKWPRVRAHSRCLRVCLALSHVCQVVEVLHNLAESVKSEEAGATKYQVFQDRSQGDELVVLEQYGGLPLCTLRSPPRSALTNVTQIQRQSCLRSSRQLRPLPKSRQNDGR